MPVTEAQITIQPIFEYGTPMASSIPCAGNGDIASSLVYPIWRILRPASTSSSGVSNSPIAATTLSSPLPSLSLISASLRSAIDFPEALASDILVTASFLFRSDGWRERMFFLRQHAFHFRDGNHRQEAGEQQEQRKEQS